ncbi:MAG TPA: response regulator [Rhizomicrobium sp.]|jgi:two-component sensor histidine kinase/DNA-binding response OmpR family regulator
MSAEGKLNILLVDDQPAKLLSYEVMLAELGENLIKASSAREALEQLLKNEIAVILVDVCMPEQDGFELAAMIREHPRFQKTAIIFISAIHMAEVDHLRGYMMGAVDYMPVPVIPQVLRAKVKVFVELFRKTKQLEQFNLELERRVDKRTAELASSNAKLVESEQRRNMALSAGNMGSWDWDIAAGSCLWDDGLCRIFDVEPGHFEVTLENVRARFHPEDWRRLLAAFADISPAQSSWRTDFRVVRSDGEMRWCIGTAAATYDEGGRLVRLSGVAADITERKRIEDHQALLAREVDHRAKNSLAVVQSIVRLTRADSIKAYMMSVEGRIQALSKVHSLLAHSRWQGADLHTLVQEELTPYQMGGAEHISISGPRVQVTPPVAQTLALALHELATNAAKYGALSVEQGRVRLSWQVTPRGVEVTWSEMNGPPVTTPQRAGLGLQMIGSGVQSLMGGNANFDWRPKGLECALTVPCAEGRDLARASLRRGAAEPLPAPSAGGRPRVLVVEDEALVAMMVTGFLEQIDCAIVGPCATCFEALSLLKENQIDAAILDVNLDGETVYPVADALARQNVPFVFATGYGREAIEKRFAHVTTLEKPVSFDQLRSAMRELRRNAPESSEVVNLRA